MKRRIALYVLLTALLMAFPGCSSALAADGGSIKLTALAQVEIVVVNVDGQKEIRRVPAEKVVPGTEVIYTIGYSNTGTKSAEGVVITNPIPEHMIYREGTASGSGTDVRFSADGGKVFDVPENLKVTEEDGTVRLAKPAEYTHIRWTVKSPIARGASGKVVYRAKLE